MDEIVTKDPINGEAINKLHIENKNAIKNQYKQLYIENNNKPVNVDCLPNKLYKQIIKLWGNKLELDAELSIELGFNAKINWTEAKTKEIYYNLCVENNGPVFQNDLKIWGGLSAAIIKFFGTKYELERMLGYHKYELIPPIETTYIVEPIVDNPKYLFKRFGDMEKECTGEEIFLVRTMSRKRIDGKVKRVFTEPINKKLIDLTKKDYIGIKINEKSEQYQYNGAVVFDSHYNKIIEKTIDVNDPKLWWLVGRWLGDGWLRYTKRKKRKNGHQTWVELCCGKHELSELLEFFERFQVHYNYTENRTTYRFKITKHEWYSFFSQFGKLATGKFIPDSVKNLPVDLLEQLIIGYFSADGNLYEARQVYKATSVSPRLMYDIQACIEKVYHSPVSYCFTKRPPKHVIEGRIVNQKNTYSILFKKDVRKQDKAFYEDSHIWYPVTYVKPILNG